LSFLARVGEADDPFRIVIVRDMWLTGLDAPSDPRVFDAVAGFFKFVADLTPA
jgi:hypothetical protein